MRDGITATQSTRQSRDRVYWRRVLMHNLVPYLFLFPALMLFALFSWYPIVRGFIISFQRVDLLGPTQWVGLANFQLVLNDPLFVQAWLNTLQFAGMAFFLGYFVPIILALAVNEMRRGRNYFQLAFYLPVMLPPMVSVILWKWFYDPGPGLMNTLLRMFQLPPQLWLQSPDTAMFSLVILSTWANAGGTMLLYLAALQGIPAHLYDAAEIDGANVGQRLMHVTLPQLRSVMLILLVLQIIGTMQVFTEPFVMTDGGPVNATLTVMLLLYRYAFQYGNFGAAGALGLMLFVVLVAFSIVYLWLTRRIGGED
ncbi:MAG: sugar ABC transporter permease [Chloroflexi bacterium AL-W]|nr:sugar ABC transporter permease [Chloroflexi bacterium AL-N1]NOK70062.1 sugar ABC transporter permease [Chloroflexi bacterium AL-N10]NOK77926.1 sugar ABC transporter permease [Chloroflexi bacterium AL-N5]NOK84935.1 sugar ABC transporter permease [Chloroflexi bacterium AL-W]NOK91914.1 sugar ABC transporter permease [Chloroflexi bacterium AL-N15]